MQGSWDHEYVLANSHPQKQWKVWREDDTMEAWQEENLRKRHRKISKGGWKNTVRWKPGKNLVQGPRSQTDNFRKEEVVSGAQRQSNFIRIQFENWEYLVAFMTKKLIFLWSLLWLTLHQSGRYVPPLDCVMYFIITLWHYIVTICSHIHFCTRLRAQ